MKLRGKWVELGKVFSVMVDTDPINLTGSRDFEDQSLCQTPNKTG